MLFPLGMMLIGRLGMGGEVACSLVVAETGDRLGRVRPLKSGEKKQLETRQSWRRGLWLRLGVESALQSGLKALMGSKKTGIGDQLSTFCACALLV